MQCIASDVLISDMNIIALYKAYIVWVQGSIYPKVFTYLIWRIVYFQSAYMEYKKK